MYPDNALVCNGPWLRGYSWRRVPEVKPIVCVRAFCSLYVLLRNKCLEIKRKKADVLTFKAELCFHVASCLSTCSQHSFLTEKLGLGGSRGSHSIYKRPRRRSGKLPLQERTVPELCGEVKTAEVEDCTCRAQATSEIIMCSCAKDTSTVCGENDVLSSVKKHYGKDSTTSKCVISGVNTLTCAPSVPKHVREAFADVHDEVTLRYYGCGSAIPEAVEGCSILDLGSGSGRDCFALSKLVGPSGRVVGVDMTEEQLNCAKTYIDYHTQKFGYSQPNVEFVFGYIEKLGEAGLQEGSFDLIISNCVINLSPDKKSTLKEAFRVLKEGGEFYFSDIYTDTVLSEEARKDQFLWGECFSGALLWEELYQLAAEIGFSSPRLVTAKLADTSMYGEKLGSARFTSVTYRLFKLPAQGASSPCRVCYTGGIIGSPDSVAFDYATLFKKGEEKVVDSELASILKTSRFKQYFSITDAPGASPETTDPKVDPYIAENAAAPKKSCCSKQCC